MDEITLLKDVENKVRIYLGMKKSWDNRLLELRRLKDALRNLDEFRLTSKSSGRDSAGANQTKGYMKAIKGSYSKDESRR